MPTGQGSPLWEGTVTRGATPQACTRCAKPARSSSARPRPPSSRPATRSHETRNPYDPAHAGRLERAARPPRSAPAWCRPGLAPRWSARSCGRRASAACVGFKPSVGAINRSGSLRPLQPELPGRLGATLADAWAVVRAIADRAGGDPGYSGLSRRRRPLRPRRPTRLAVLETGGWGRPPRGARRPSRPPGTELADAGVELRSRADDPEIEALEQRSPTPCRSRTRINAWEGRWPLNTYADLDAEKLSAGARERLKTAEAMTQGDYARADDATRSGRANLRQGRKPLRRLMTLGACGAAPIGLGSTGNTDHERDGLAARLPGADAAGAGGRGHAARPAAHRRGIERDAALFSAAAGRSAGAGSPGPDRNDRVSITERLGYAACQPFHKLLNCVATTSSYLPTPLVTPVVCANRHMLSNASLEIAG